MNDLLNKADGTVLCDFLIPHQPSQVPSELSPPAQLKDWFDEARYRALARELSQVESRFDVQGFLKFVLSGLAERSLMQRLHQTAVAAEKALPGSFRDKVDVLQKLAPRIRHEFVSIFTCDFVASYGAGDFDFSMEALRFLTRFGSAEFAVRPFIATDQKRALKTMLRWTKDTDEKVRRLASEGSRPRLPWGLQLKALVRDPEPTAVILEALKEDKSLFVRRSVANHLNDITKDHPELVLGRLEGWDMGEEPLRWIAKHACRTLIKRGNPRALKLFGFGGRPAVAAVLSLTPAKLMLGDRLQMEATLTSTSTKTQRLAIDYVIHYVKARGELFAKVFKWTEIDLPAKQAIALNKSQVIRDFSTRKHHPGHHQVELQVNGTRLVSAGFVLQGKAS
jgi:3-methyladenine DNA glycosylase AlkC